MVNENIAVKDKYNKSVTFICQQLRDGGAERVISILVKYFVEREYRVQLILLFDEHIDYEIPDNIDIIFMNWKKKMDFKRLSFRIRELRKSIKGENVISVLFLSIFYTILATRFSEKCVIVSERNDPHNDPPGKIRKFIRTLAYCFAEHIVFQTEDAKKYFPNVIQRKGIIIPNPVKDGIKARNGIVEEKKVVSVCRLNSQKNIKMSIDAFAVFLKKNVGYIFEIYGDGELYNDIIKYIREKKLEKHIFLMGFHKNIHEKIKNAVMYISSSDYEGISNSMLEAMALGLPVICTDCPIGGARQVIKNGFNGILINVGDTAALAKAMDVVANDIKLRHSLSNNAMLVNQEYKASAICSMWEELIRG